MNNSARFVGGIGATVLAVLLLLFTDAAVGAAVTILIVGLALIAVSRRG